MVEIEAAQAIYAQVIESEEGNESAIGFEIENENESDPGGDRPHDEEASWPTVREEGRDW